MEDTYFENDMECVANYVLENDLVEGAVEGIAKQLIDKGWNSLSPKQAEVFQNDAIPKATVECANCGMHIPFNELEFGEGRCGWCQHQKDKRDREDAREDD